KTLAAYVGQYKMAPGLILTITRQDDQLFAATPGGRWRLYPRSETGFYAKATALRLRFEMSPDGQVEKVVGLLGSQGLTGRPVRPATLTAEQLAAYAGDYYSAELRVIYT